MTSERTLRDCHVLVVEDEWLVAEELHSELAEAGAVIIGPVAGLQDALEVIRQEARIDGAILDINLQGELVFPVADLLIERGVPFVFTTGYDKSVIPTRFERVVRCEKPTPLPIVVGAIGRLMHSSGLPALG